jgi:hypothetical protein
MAAGGHGRAHTEEGTDEEGEAVMSWRPAARTWRCEHATQCSWRQEHENGIRALGLFSCPAEGRRRGWIS